MENLRSESDSKWWERYGQAGGGSFSNAFGFPLKFALLYDLLKLRKECVFNGEILRWSESSPHYWH